MKQAVVNARIGRKAQTSSIRRSVQNAGKKSDCFHGRKSFFRKFKTNLEREMLG